jgi:hypothetical protein
MIDPIRDTLKEHYGITARDTGIGASIEFLRDSDELSSERYDAYELGGLRNKKAIQEKIVDAVVYKLDADQYYAVVSSKDPLPDDKKIVDGLDHYVVESGNEYDIWASYERIEPQKPIENRNFRVFKLTPRPDHTGEIGPITTLDVVD